MEAETHATGISFIIPVLNGDQYVIQCLDSVFAEKSLTDEVVVVDNGSTDNTIELAKSYCGLKLLQYTRLTRAASRNRGASASRHNILAFIDADCVLGENWRSNVVTVMSDRSIAATGSGVDVPETANWIENAWFSQKLRVEQPVSYINTSNLVVRRQAFEAVSGFDETLVTDEDCDLGARLNAAHLRVLEAPQIRAVHLDNPRTLVSFFKKQLWRATSSLESQTWTRVDKPTLMTVIFLFSILLAGAAIPLSALRIEFLWLAALLPAILVTTSLYRVVQYRNPRYFFELHLLYLLFFLARSVVVVRAMLNSGRT